MQPTDPNSSTLAESTASAPDACAGGGQLGWAIPSVPKELARVPSDVLAAALVRRIVDGEGLHPTSADTALGMRLSMLLEQTLDVHENRFGRQRLRDYFTSLYERFSSELPPVRDATVLDIGCGAVNPFAMSMLFLALGARRSIAVDLDPIVDMADVLQATVRTAEYMITAPASVVGRYPISSVEVARNLAGFDFARMLAKDFGALDADKLTYKMESVHNLSLPDRSVDMVFSIAFLEHIPRLAAGLAELARVTREGGVHVHIIDLQDHRAYGNPSIHPLEFLKDPRTDDIVEGCNRHRAGDFIRHFEAAGFEVRVAERRDVMQLDDKFLRQLTPQYRSLPAEELGALRLALVARRHG